MRYRKLPKSDLTLSEIGLGCYALTGAYGRKDKAGFARVIARAYELGVTFFDTADHYGEASEVLGQAVKGFRDKVVIATKVGVTEDGGRDLSPAHVVASCEESLRHLGTDHIDLFQVHFDDPKTPVAETAAAMEELRSAGGSRHGRTSAQTAIAWVLAQPAVVSALTGPSSLEHLEENLAASGFTLAPEELAELEALFMREDEAVANFRRERMAAILAAPLDADPDAALRDLVFVMEAAAEFGLLDEARLLEVARPVLGARRKSPAEAAADLAEAQRLLRELLKL